MGVLELVSSVFGGGITGLIGTGVQRYFEFQTKKLDLQASKDKYAHEAAMKQADAAIMAQEWAARTQVAQVETQGKIEESENQAFAVALASEPQRYSAGATPNKNQAWLLFVLDFIRGLVRPGLTIYLCVITTIIYVQARTLMGGQPNLPTDRTIDMVNRIIETVLYLTTTCVLFWFGTRNKQNPPTLTNPPSSGPGAPGTTKK